VSHESSTCTQSRSRTRHRRDARIGDDTAPSSFHPARLMPTTRAAARARASRRGADRDSTRRSGRGIGGARRRASSSSSVRSVASSRDARGHVSTRARPRGRARIPRGVATVLDASFQPSRDRDGTSCQPSRRRDGTSCQPSRRRRRGILTLSWVNSVIEVYTSILSSCNFNFEHLLPSIDAFFSLVQARMGVFVSSV